jgi:hypothetical protein
LTKNSKGSWFNREFVEGVYQFRNINTYKACCFCATQVEPNIIIEEMV